MKITELRNLDKEDLQVKLATIKEDLAKLRYAKAVGQVEKPHRFRMLRRTIARIETLLNEPEKSSKE